VRSPLEADCWRHLWRDDVLLDHIQNALNLTWLSSRESVPNNFNQSRLTVTVGEGSGDSKSLFCEVVALSIRDA
jgi:hypothetical protein